MSVHRRFFARNIILCFSCMIIITACNDLSGSNQSESELANSQEIPIGGNTWQEGEPTDKSNISKEGVTQWENSNTTFKTFFRVNDIGSLKLWMKAKVIDGESTIEANISGETKNVVISNSAFDDVYIGEWNLQDTGYVAVELKGVSKTGDIYADIESLKIAGEAVNEDTKYVKNDEGNFFYWGRRGPSVHLGYQVPEEINAKWYYNEITVPEGEDVVGSYYMANGFSGGYFGIQANSDTERRVLFSVWSPYDTDNPAEIPDDHKIKLLKKGEGVSTGEFGNEGSGGQSFLRYNWKTGNTYKFLLKGEPVENDFTNYTAWFFAPEEGEWRLIASFSRPKTNTWLKGFHSFLENFNPDQGVYERKVNFSNQWVADTDENWIEIDQAKFTADNTARVEYRLDYAGGEENGQFYLRNCGFFDDYTAIGELFKRPKANQKPAIDFNELP